MWFYLHGMSRKASLETQKVDEWLLRAQNANRNEGSFGSDGNVPKLDYGDAVHLLINNHCIIHESGV